MWVWIVVGIFVFAILIIGAALAICILPDKTKIKKGKEIMKSGTKIDANYIDVIKYRVRAIGDSSPMYHYYKYFVICSWKNPKDNKYYLFSSIGVEKNPKMIIEEKGVVEIPVYFSGEDIANYYMDLEFLKEGQGGISYEK